MKALCVLIGAFLLQAWLRPEAVPANAAPRALRSTAANLVFSGARPLLARWLWFDFEASIGRGALPRALDDLRLLLVLGSEDPRVPLHLARFLAFDLAPREGAAPERMQRVFEAEEILQRGRQQFPGDPHFALLHAQILSMPWALDERLHGVWRKRHGGTPQQGAAKEYAEVARLAPGSPHAALLAGDAARWAAIERLLSGEAQAWADIALAAQEIERGRVAAGEILLRLTAAWKQAADAMLANDPNAAALRLSKVFAPAEDLPAEEVGLVQAVVPLLCDAIPTQNALTAARALSAVEALHSICLRSAASSKDNHALVALKGLVQRIVAADPSLRLMLPAVLRAEK